MRDTRWLPLGVLFVAGALFPQPAEAAVPAPPVYAYCVEMGVPGLKPRPSRIWRSCCGKSVSTGRATRF